MDRIVARRALLAAAVVGIVAQSLFFGLAFGVNVVVVTAVVLVDAAALGRFAGRRPDPAAAAGTRRGLVSGWSPTAPQLLARLRTGEARICPGVARFGG